MPPVMTNPDKVRHGKVDMNARRLGNNDDIRDLRVWDIPGYRPMRYDFEGRGILPKATGLPNHVKKRKSLSQTDSDTAGPSAKRSKSNGGDPNKPNPLDISGISLDNDLDEDGDVRVFDTCETIRRKIRTFLTKYQEEGVTQAAFLRAITNAAFAETEPRRKIQSAQLVTFMGQRGTMTGNTTGVYYAAYVFFEKLRIKEGKPKTADRKIVEAYHVDGLDRSMAPDQVWWLVSSRAEGITMDKYGRPNVYYGSDWKGNPDGYDKDDIPDPDEQFRMLGRQFDELEETGNWILPRGFPLPSKD